MTQFPPIPPPGTDGLSSSTGRSRASGGTADFQGSLDGARQREAPPLDSRTLELLARIIRHRLASAAFGGGSGRGPLGSMPAMLHGILQQQSAHPGQVARPERPGPSAGEGAAPAPEGEGGEGAASGAVPEPGAEAEAPPETAGAGPGDGPARPYGDLIREAAHRHEVPEPLVRAVVRAESGFDPEAVSPAGAQGLMQLMPGTAEELGVSDPFDPRENVMAGTRYLRRLLDRYDGDRELALAAYNWGMGNLEDSPDALPEETVTYVQRVTRWADGVAA
jgi:hypothetical protein